MMNNQAVIKQVTIELPHIRLSAIEMGDKHTADIHLICLHGWLDNAASFCSVFQSINEQLEHHDSVTSPRSDIPSNQISVYALAIDLPGHGLSEHKNADNFYPFHDYLADLHQLLCQIGADRVVLVGHSLGALITSCYSAVFAEKVLGLVQIEGLGPMAEDPKMSVDRVREGIVSRQRCANKPHKGYLTRQQALEHRMHVNQLTAAQLEPLIERGTYFDGERWHWRYDAKLKCHSLYRMSEQQAGQFIQAITCPSLVILGQQGFPQLQKAIERDALFNDLDKILIEGGHHCHLQNPQTVAQHIISFSHRLLNE